MKKAMNKSTTCKLVLAVIVLVAVVFYFLNSQNISVETLLDYSPENPFLAACMMLVLYAIKCLTIVFPLVVLEITTGHLFSTGIALLVNLTGLVIILTIPHFIGRHIGMSGIEKLTKRYPKFLELLLYQQENSFFLCFFLRVISCLPGDLLTRYFGAPQTPYWQNMLGGILGILPGMILATLLGSSIEDPSSPMFWGSILLTIALSVTSFVSYYLYRRHLHNKMFIEEEGKHK